MKKTNRKILEKEEKKKEKENNGILCISLSFNFVCCCCCYYCTIQCLSTLLLHYLGFSFTSFCLFVFPFILSALEIKTTIFKTPLFFSYFHSSPQFFFYLFISPFHFHIFNATGLQR